MRRYVTLVVALCWLVLVILVYYWVHKPITPRLVEALGGALLDTLSAGIMVGVAGGSGRKLIRAGLGEWATNLSRAEQLAGEALAGLGMVALGIFLIGLVHLSAVSVALWLLLLLTLSWRENWAWASEWWAWLWSFDRQQFGGLRWFIGLNLLLAWVMAAAPPTTFDTLTYHLVGARQWVEAGQFEALPGNHFFAFPQMLNTLYTGQMALLMGRLTGAAILHGLIGCLWLMAVGGYAARRFSPWAGWLAAAVLLSASSIWLQFTWAYVDLLPGLCGMLTFIALEQWRFSESEASKWGWIILVGVFVGLAMSSKYNALLLGVGVGVYLLVYGWREGFTSLLKYAGWFGVAASMVLLPWLLRNLAFYDNPIYPFGSPTGEWDHWMNEWYTNADRAALREEPLLTFPILVSPTFLGVEGGPWWSATIGPLFLLLIPLLLMVWTLLEAEWRKSLGSLVLLVGVFHGLWLLTAGISVYGAQTRFMFPMFGWLAVLAAVALQGLSVYPRQPLDFGWMVRVVVMLVLGLTLLNHLANIRPRDGDKGLQGTTLESHFAETRTLEYLLGVIDQQTYLEHALGWHIRAMDEVNTLPTASKIMFLWETRSLYCDEPRITCVEDTILARWWHSRRTVGTAEQILAHWQAEGITHILVWEDGREFEFEDNTFLTTDDNAEFARLVGLLEPVWSGESYYTLYKLP